MTVSIASEREMTTLGRRLATILLPGDTVLLRGPIGAGKSHLARAIIQTRLDNEEDIPSPTFTLVQTYRAGDAEIWHADLYRLGDSSELVELGLDDAMEQAIVLIEWPDRLPPEMLPTHPLEIEIDHSTEVRRVTLSADGRRWTEIADRLSNE